MKLVKSIAMAAMGAVISASAAMADYPEKPVQFVVPWPPGDLEDVLTRMIAEDFAAEYDVAAAVVNKPGGDGGPFPGAIEVANAPADGYTVGSFIPDITVIGPYIGIPDLADDPFEPLGIFVTYPFVIATSKDAPYDTIEELAAYTKDNKVSLGHFGYFATPTVATLAVAKKLDFEFSSDSAFDFIDCNTLASGDADVVNTTMQLVLPCVDDLKFLLTVANERTPLAPDTRTMAELDPELDFSTWNGLFVHKDTPQDVRDKIIAVAERTMASDRAQELAQRTGALVYWQNAEDSVARIEADKATIGKFNEIIGPLE